MVFRAVHGQRGVFHQGDSHLNRVCRGSAQADLVDHAIRIRAMARIAYVVPVIAAHIGFKGLPAEFAVHTPRAAQVNQLLPAQQASGFIFH